METWKARLKDNREVILRFLTPDDRDLLLAMFSSMSDDALLWGMPPYDENTIDRWLSNIDNLIPVVAIFEDKIVGYSAIFKYGHSRRKGNGDMGIYLHQDFHGVGLGTAMTEQMLELASSQGLHRIMLEVVRENIAAVGLYKKVGFKVEGELEDAYFGADGKYHNSLIMGKILSKISK